MQKEKTSEEATNATSTLFTVPCFDKQWILQTNEAEKINDYVCLICRQIANNALELNCPQHEDADELLIVGDQCLKQFLKENRNSCPIGSHEGCQYSKSRPLQKYIGDLTVMCLKQFEQELRKEKEEEIPGINKCDFKGKLKEIKDHLDKSCPLSVINCWFKPFGCNYICHRHNLDKHLIANMKFHFGLVIQSFQSMTQTIQLHQVYFFHFFLKKTLQVIQNKNKKRMKAIN
ncbi:hypothetical protein RFI_34767 [Reticulomyxa filosa]|uniref:TRAF-type domain-containing protein n=1 Tax=Reticulomyxa filosa TaxID=46433 RepID=X6LPJ0_RETFI|nr:hypothetical protein RFI_34767 [Reticulomyxa filosa]|eukprot:ETO02650.1 hypothetical protein RFI_34767 [Reticulomyxa filosa]